MLSPGDFKISKLFLGDTEYKKAYLGDTIVFEKKKTSRLPEGYTEVEYIQTNDYCKINTGQSGFSATLKLTMDICPEEYSGTGWLFLAQYSGGNGRWYRVSCYWSDTSIFSQCGTSSQIPLITKKVIETDYFPRRITISLNWPKRTVSVDDKSVTFTNFSATSYATNLFLLGYSETSFLTAKLYSCQMEDDGKPIRDFVPCIDPSGEVGLYDLINSKFYANVGTGAFTAGPAV